MEQNNSLPRILVFIDWYLPGYKAGGPVRSMANMIDHLSGSFAFDVVTRNTEYMEITPYPSVRSDQWNTLAPNVRVWYASSNKEGLGQWRQLMREGHYHLIYINGIYSPIYSILPLLAAKLEKQTNIVVAPRGMLAESAIGVKRGKKTVFLKLAKMAGLFRNIAFHATNDNEANQTRQHLNANATIHIAANLPKKQDLNIQLTAKETGKLHLVSLARIAPEKNTLYAIQCLENITDKQIVLKLYGQIYDEPYWEQCLELIARLPKNITVAHCGTVHPDEVGKTIAANHALLLPSRGENFGHVILESLMAGRPVIISDQTPWRNLESKMAGFDLPLQDMNAFTQTVGKMAGMDQDSFNRWCNGAAQVAREFVEDKGLLGRYEEMFGE